MEWRQYECLGFFSESETKTNEVTKNQALFKNVFGT